jgi:hypothetical protein
VDGVGQPAHTYCRIAPLANRPAWPARWRGVAVGVRSIDQVSPHGGLARGHLHEVIVGGAASEYARLATLFAASLTQHGGKAIRNETYRRCHALAHIAERF